ncbi:energy transducer TonB [Arenibacter sp. BSSL-BM3]|uniref:Energy transducer TonB n=1 Tax=Arenibacter arenosicollis TaxID=2762274 RepID=A0ABR7QHB2_9FLAO|nr:energy transducer TonB [Arenibacter arenosicollis]MBC8766429.1 energy transducer TonB [Arenibacter arenosicollis]
MEPKKNPRADLNKKSGLFFVIGLTIVLFLVWGALELKTYPKENAAIEQLTVTDYLEEKVPVTEALNVPPTPPPPAAPEIIEIVEDVAEIEETVIQSTEINQETIVEEATLKVEDIAVVEEEEEDIEVPFAVIENVPVFPGCKETNNEAQKACFQKKIQEHIIKQFTYPDVAVELGIEGKVYVQFIIDNTGYITNIRTRGPDKLLEKEANRIIAALPQMTPGKQRGRAVKVPYTIPITFRLQ